MEACPPASPQASTPADRNEVFVELTLLELPRALAAATFRGNLPDLAYASDVALLATPHLLASFERPSQSHPGVEPLGDASVALSTITLLPRRAEEGVTVLAVQLALRSRNGTTQTYPFSVSAREDEPGVARVDIAAGRSVLALFRLRAVHREADLRAIFECKMRRAQQARASHH